MDAAATRLNCEDIQGWQGRAGQGRQWLEGICFSAIMSVFPVDCNDQRSPTVPLPHNLLIIELQTQSVSQLTVGRLKGETQS